MNTNTMRTLVLLITAVCCVADSKHSSDETEALQETLAALNEKMQQIQKRVTERAEENKRLNAQIESLHKTFRDRREDTLKRLGPGSSPKVIKHFNGIRDEEDDKRNQKALLEEKQLPKTKTIKKKEGLLVEEQIEKEPERRRNIGVNGQSLGNTEGFMGSGKGKGGASFEEDMYVEMTQMKSSLHKVEKMLGGVLDVVVELQKSRHQCEALEKYKKENQF